VLFLVATPIGNLGDISARALEILRLVDVIAAEDTRHSGNLLRHFGIQKALVSYHAHNEARRTAELITSLEAGKKIALITDAGLPSISDPGHRLLAACIERALPYTVIPGPSAVLTALVGSGFPSERFCFRGFLPVKSGQRESELQEASERSETTLFFESPHRLLKTLEAATRFLPDRLLCVARELTKQFEEYRRGTASELVAHYTATPVRGEIVLLVAGRTAKESRQCAREARRTARHRSREATQSDGEQPSEGA
jgi:16S rRNA (cytidine1402-2'-O)-methyltransferase